MTRPAELRLLEPEPQTSFGRIALRMGVVSSEELAQAQALRRERSWQSLETILVDLGVLAPELADGVRSAWLRTMRQCEHCGRRRDLHGWMRGELGCGCASSAQAA